MVGSEQPPLTEMGGGGIVLAGTAEACHLMSSFRLDAPWKGRSSLRTLQAGFSHALALECSRRKQPDRDDPANPDRTVHGLGTPVPCEPMSGTWALVRRASADPKH